MSDWVCIMGEKAPKQIIANLIDTEESRIAILDGRGRLCDFFIERSMDHQRTNEIYKAKVDNVLQGMHAAFLNLGDGKNGFLYLADARGIDVKPGKDMLVQVVKNARKDKGARVSPRLSLAGRYLVLIPGGKETGVSKRIEDEAERERLRDILRECKPENCGVIIRTAAVNAEKGALLSDIRELTLLWEKIQADAAQNSAPCLLHREPGLLERVLRDELNDDICEIVVDTEEDCENIKTCVKQFMPGKEIDVTYYGGTAPVFDVYGIEKQLLEAQERKVWLSSGAYLVIDQTEALTVIDVNTGKFTGSKNLDDTVFKTNMEAASEIARQLRLRAIGGIVIIDFIDMATKEENDMLVAELNRQFKEDRCKVKIHGVTDLGLVEITRKRARLDLHTEMMHVCPRCTGLGTVEKEESVAMRIKRFIRKICCDSKDEVLLLECFRTVAEYIAETVLSSWEEEFEKKIILYGNTDIQWGKYRLDMQGTMEQTERRIIEMQKKENRSNVYRTPSA